MCRVNKSKCPYFLRYPVDSLLGILIVSTHCFNVCRRLCQHPGQRRCSLQPPPPIRIFALGGEAEEGGHREQRTRRRVCRPSGVACAVCAPTSQHLYFASMTASCCRWPLWPGRRLVSRHSSVPRIVRSKQTSPRPAPAGLGSATKQNHFFTPTRSGN